MSIRPLDLLDLPVLYRYRHEVASLDSTRLLVHGNPLSTAGLVAAMNPRQHNYAALAEENGAAVLGGVNHIPGDAFARLHYLAPVTHLEHPELPALIERLVAEAGSWGVFHILAEVEENSAAFLPLRRAGFSVYAWQRIWDFSTIRGEKGEFDWMRVRSVHLPALQSLYQQIVPPLLHPIEPLPVQGTGWLCNDGAKCYFNVVRGAQGMVLLPLIHPETAQVSEKLLAFLAHLNERRDLPVYFCVRSYQAWLEPVLEDLGATGGPRQAVMVRRLTQTVKEPELTPALEKVLGRARPAAPLRMEQVKEKQSGPAGVIK
ncbi:MAG: hypothetical protein ACP5QU_01580 [Anaerolineae bacterium]